MSIGIIVFMLLVGLPPFQGKSSRKLMEEARVGYFSFTHPLWRNVSVQARDFVKKLTSRQICNETSLRSYLSDPWLMNMNKPNMKRTSLSIDILDNLKKFNVLN